MILVTKPLIKRDVCVCVCVIIKLHITAQSGPVIQVLLWPRIDPPKGGSMILVTKTSDQTRRVCVCVCVCVFIRCVCVCIF